MPSPINSDPIINASNQREMLQKYEESRERHIKDLANKKKIAYSGAQTEELLTQIAKDTLKDARMMSAESILPVSEGVISEPLSPEIQQMRAALQQNSIPPSSPKTEGTYYSVHGKPSRQKN